MYVTPNFKTKKELKAAVKQGLPVKVISAGEFPATVDGDTSVEGPHAPQMHTWYARVQVRRGLVTKVIS